MNREELIQLCKDAVVPVYNWKDRDSYSAQLQLADAYSFLMVGVPFKVEKIEDETIWVSFAKLNETQISNLNKFKLEIGTREEWFEWYKKEHNEEADPYDMFDSNGLSINGGTCYLPTRERLNEVNGDDWY